MTALAQLNEALVGRYEIEREVGKGGMATVYLARDVRHHRQVALKVLDPELAAVLGAERFLSEIRVTANLQHPNLLPLFDSGEAGGLLFYVMPYIVGESLRARIEREKQLPVIEALRIATGIANALDYAHRQGVIHRDLKPENILLQDGEPLIADFGIALAVTKAGGTRVTQTGLSLGTPQYMSPEQATGDRGIDNRTDIYSLGALTYEMLSGEPPHSGTTAQAIIARLMTEEPRALSAIRRAIPEHVESAVRCALEKLPADRFQTAKEFADALNGRVAALPGGTRSVPRAKQKRQLTISGVAVGVVAVALTAGATWSLSSRLKADPLPVRMEILPPPGIQFADPQGKGIAISDDGRTIAYLAGAPGADWKVYIRHLSEWESRPISGTDRAWEPRFSPHGNSILFFANNAAREVRKGDLNGALVTTLQKEVAWGGGAWGSDGTVVVATGGGLIAFDGDGGTPRTLVKNDSGSRTVSVNDPFVIPSEKIIAFRNTSRLATVPMQGGPVTKLDLQLSNPIAFDRGWLIFGRADGSVSAVELKKKGTVLGDRIVPLLEGVAFKSSGGAEASVSSSGTLTYLSGTSGGHVVLNSLDGKQTSQGKDLRQFHYPRFSPDGRKIALTVLTATASEIWVLEVATGTLSRVTQGSRPDWTPDGKRIVFVADSTRYAWVVPLDASAPPEQLTSSGYTELVMLPDGKGLVGRTNNIGVKSADIMFIPLEGERKPQPLVASPSVEIMPRVSPDGKWLAYASNESGNYEVFVRPLHGGARTQVSATGGVQPVWAPGGRRIYYMKDGSMYAADVQDAGTSLNVIRRDSLFHAQFSSSSLTHQQYDVSPDGKQIVGVVMDVDDRKLRVITNWLSEVRQKLR